MSKRFSTIALLLGASMALGACSPFGRAPDAFEQGRAAYDDGRLPEASERFREYTHARPDDVVGWYNLGLTWQDLGLVDEARSAYERALALRADDARTLVNLATLELGAGNSQRATELLTQALKHEPARAYPCYAMGHLCESLGDITEAETWYRTGVTREPKHVEANRRLALLLHHRGVHSEALKHFGVALASASDDLVVLGETIRCACDAEQWQDALTTSEHLAYLAPERGDDILLGVEAALWAGEHQRGLVLVWLANAHGHDAERCQMLEARLLTARSSAIGAE